MMTDSGIRLTSIGGPTVLIELAGLRLLTDPTFDPAGTDYPTNVYTLHKTVAPAVDIDALAPIDAILLSHDHHFDNLDHAGRALLPSAGKVLTTTAGAQRLGGNAIGLEPWQEIDLPAKDGQSLRVTATPARHGPAGADRGPVIGFAVSMLNPSVAIYVSGDTVWFEGVAEMARRFPISLAILSMGAARVPEVGPDHLTFTADEGVEVARALPDALIVPVHSDGWAHFSEGRAEIQRAFAAAGIEQRLLWLAPGRATMVHVP